MLALDKQFCCANQQNLSHSSPPCPATACLPTVHVLAPGILRHVRNERVKKQDEDADEEEERIKNKKKTEEEEGLG